MKRVSILAAVAALMMTLFAAAPASATVDELTGMPCSGGNAIFGPPGITGENGASDRGGANFAKPLFATGFATFVPGGGPGGDDLISFDGNHPASKITLTGGLVEIEPGLWITDFVFNDLPCPGDDQP